VSENVTARCYGDDRRDAAKVVPRDLRHEPVHRGPTTRAMSKTPEWRAAIRQGQLGRWAAVRAARVAAGLPPDAAAARREAAERRSAERAAKPPKAATGPRQPAYPSQQTPVWRGYEIVGWRPMTEAELLADDPPDEIKS
jgi:hypothetical protein